VRISRNLLPIKEYIIKTGTEGELTMKSAFSFKVTTEGVTINFNPDVEYQKLKKELKNHVKEASNFFAGVNLYLNLQNQCFEASQLDEIKNIVSGYNNINKVYFVGSKNKIKERDTILLKGTIRSGQRIKYPTNIVLIGDVNPGAEVIAAGDIIVLGRLRGVVHAGARGMDTAQVIAFKLQPTQVRIASYISRSPEEEKKKKNIFEPERAYVKDSKIVVEKIDI